jgi:hypothetical protein
MTMMTTADFASLYPPYIWIPASAGVTRRVQQDAAGGSGGVPQVPLFSSPKIGGFQGVEDSTLTFILSHQGRGDFSLPGVGESQREGAHPR